MTVSTISSTLSIEQFASTLKPLGYPQQTTALYLLWYLDQQSNGVVKTSGELSRLMNDYHLGSPHSTRLGDLIVKTKHVNKRGGGFQLKPGSRSLIYNVLREHLTGVSPSIDHSKGYLSEDVWHSTRGYVESIARQLNGCHKAAYYDAASVMLRRLIETLIIEAYEHLGRRSEITDSDGNPFMLRHLVLRAKGEGDHKGLNLGRDAKRSLDQVKELGDRSAHNRRFIAKNADLEALRSGVRLTVQELIQIAHLQKQ